MGVLYYAEYLHIFERARNEYIRGQGVTYAHVEERGVYLPVREAACRYRKPARYDDLLRINAGVTEWKRASFVIRYLVWDEGRATLMAEGMTEHVCVGKDGRPQIWPEWFKALF